MINKQDISSIVLEKDITDFQEQEDFYLINKNTYIDKIFIDKLFDKFKVIDCKKEIKECDKNILIFVDPLSSGLLNFGWYIKLINFLNDYKIKPILIFSDFSIQDYFLEGLKSIVSISEYEIIFKNINLENYTNIKKDMINKYNSRILILTSFYQLIFEKEFNDYILLLHDDFIDQYDAPWTHANKIKKELFDSSLSFFNLVLYFLDKNNIKVFATDYVDMFKDEIKYDLIKPYFNYPDIYSPKEDKYIKTHVLRDKYLKSLDEIKLTLDYKEIKDEIYIKEPKFKYFDINKVITDNLEFAQKFSGKNRKVFLFDSSIDNPNIYKLVSGEFGLYDNLETIITATFENENSEDRIYSNIRNIIYE